MADLGGDPRAGGLRAHGVAPGDRVVVMMMNTPEVFISYRAIWRAGAVATPVIFLQTVPELRHVLTDSGATAEIVSAELRDLFRGAAEGLPITTFVVGEDVGEGATPFADLDCGEPAGIEPRADDDLAALLYTGGTTGRAKGVMLSHRGLWESGHGLQQAARTTTTTRSPLPLPLSHAYGLTVTIGALHAERRHHAARLAAHGARPGDQGHLRGERVRRDQRHEGRRAGDGRARSWPHRQRRLGGGPAVANGATYSASTFAVVGFSEATRASWHRSASTSRWCCRPWCGPSCRRASPRRGAR